MSEELRTNEEAEVQNILSDLESILSDMGPVPSVSPAAQAPTVAITPETPPPVKSADLAAGATKPSINVPAPIPMVPLTPPSPPLASRELKIELPTRAGVGSSVPSTAGPAPASVKAPGNPSSPISRAPAAAPPPKASPAQPASSYKPPIEIQMSSTPVPVVEPPKAAAPPVIVQREIPDPKPIVAAPLPAASPQPTPETAGDMVEIPANGEPIPETVPKEQIRSAVFLCSSAHRGSFDKFVQFVDSMAQHLTKKPLYFRKVLMLELSASCDAQKLLERVRGAGAACAIGLLTDAQARSLEEALGPAGLFFRTVRPEDIGKRSVALDLLVDITLLGPG